jgi:thiamine biosynthesis protein ThiI
VASQTLEALSCTENAATLPVLRPLIGLDKEEIVAKSRAIDCFETSILPYEDCCTVFTPRHPKLHPSLEELEAQEQKPDLAALEDEAFAGIHYRKVTENL